MNEKFKVLSVAKDIKGKSVLATDTGARLGVVLDLLVHPTRGLVMGVVLQKIQSEAPFAIAANDFRIGEDAVMAAPGAQVLPLKSVQFAEAACALRDLVDTNVVAENGKLIGKVNDLFVSMEKPIFAYKVTESGWQKLFGGGFYIKGDTPRAFSQDGDRLMITTQAVAHSLYKTLTDVFSPSGTLTGVRR